MHACTADGVDRNRPVYRRVHHAPEIRYCRQPDTRDAFDCGDAPTANTGLAGGEESNVDTVYKGEQGTRSN